MGGIREEMVFLFRSLSLATTIALSVVFSVFAGVLAGYYLDTWLFSGKTYPWLTIACFLFGLGGGVKNFFLLSKRFGGSEKGDKDRQSGVDGLKTDGSDR